MNVTPGRLRRQLEGLLERGYCFRSLNALIRDTASGRSDAGNAVVVTFDDGYESVYEHAWPLLQELGVPATVFVTTAYIGSPDPFPFDPWGLAHRNSAPAGTWRPLSWEQCFEMQTSGLMEFGSHSHTHRNFQGKPEELYADVVVSTRVLADRLGIESPGFAFPFGSGRRGGFNDRVLLDRLRQARVACALTTEIARVRPGSDPFGWGRLEVVDSDTPVTLEGKLEGYYEWMGMVRRIAWRMSGS